jgi:hypothetical protein
MDRLKPSFLVRNPDFWFKAEHRREAVDEANALGFVR